MTIRHLLMMAVAGSLAASAVAARADQPAATPDGVPTAATPKLSLDPLQAPAPAEAQAAPKQTTMDQAVLTMDSESSFAIHGFGDFKLNSQYITPRGLLAEKKSPQFQALMGLVFNLYKGDGFINSFSVNFGAWSDWNTHPDKGVVTGADVITEVDYFGGFDVKFAKNWDLAYTIQAWTFPDMTSGHVEADPKTEYNMDVKISYDDTDILKEFALHPYVDIFWNFTGSSSPVVANALLGRNDNTFYVEIGIAPSYTYKGITDLPITFTFPTYFSIGDSSFWGETPSGERDNFGVFSTGVKISVPLKFMPKELGSWNAYVGMTYFNTLNPALTFINSSATGDSNMILGYMGVGFGF